jgi:hypothetical protein
MQAHRVVAGVPQERFLRHGLEPFVSLPTDSVRLVAAYFGCETGD